MAQLINGAKLINGVWKDLQFYAGGVSSTMLNNLVRRIRKNQSSGPVNYIYQRAYKNVLVFAAKRYAVQKLNHELQSILPKWQNAQAKAMRDYVRRQQHKQYVDLITDQQIQLRDYGSIKTHEGRWVYAKDPYGTQVPEAMILSCDDLEGKTYTVNDVERKVVYNATTKRNETTTSKVSYQTCTYFHIDLAPEISMSSTKNVVLTQVTGRDYTRKELVSGGDLQFTVNGNIVSNESGIYPTEKVKQFLTIMNYGGIVNVNSFFFGSMNVTRVVIKDFSLNKQEYKNIQPYSFSCVAIEPDDAMQVTSDTIQTLNQELALSPMNKWYKLLLNNKLAQITANAVSTAAANAITSSASLGLDELLDFNDTDNG